MVRLVVHSDGVATHSTQFLFSGVPLYVRAVRLFGERLSATAAALTGRGGDGAVFAWRHPSLVARWHFFVLDVNACHPRVGDWWCVTSLAPRSFVAAAGAGGWVLRFGACISSGPGVRFLLTAATNKPV